MGGGTNPASEPDAASATGPGLRAAPRSSPPGPWEAGLLSEGRVGPRSKQGDLGRVSERLCYRAFLLPPGTQSKTTDCTFQIIRKEPLEARL